MKAQEIFSSHVMKRWVKKAMSLKVLECGGFFLTRARNADELLFPASCCRVENDELALGRVEGAAVLLVMGTNSAGFEGVPVAAGQSPLWFCPQSHENAVRLRRALPFTAPSSLTGLDTTFGVGDRLGIATPGHLRVFKRFRVAPVLAQQSLRELDLTGRTYDDAIDSATWAVFQEGYSQPWGADGDHLKTPQWVEKALSLGCTMITADLSDHLRTRYANGPPSVVRDAYTGLDRSYRQRLESEYPGSTLKVETGDEIVLSDDDVMRNALVYGEAIQHAARMFDAGRHSCGPFDFEISIDETDSPTTPGAHIFVVKELQRLEVTFSSLAPRFVGEFQKGVDYRGDAESFETSLRIHGAIANHFGYRLSIHSGSDKFSVFPQIGRLTGYRFHLKTSGTSWLQALRVIAQHDPVLFRSLYSRALDAFHAARTYYHVTPDLKGVPDIAKMGDGEIDRVFDNPDCRQVLHISYGEILRNPDLKERLYECLYKNIDAYWCSLERHIGRHLELLGVPRRERHST
jgi:hypothetical protein